MGDMQAVFWKTLRRRDEQLFEAFERLRTHVFAGPAIAIGLPGETDEQ